MADDAEPDSKDESEEELDEFRSALKRYKQASESSQDNRELYIEDVRFARLGKQWPEAIKAQREAEGRPCLTINRLPSVIRQVVNDARQNKPSIKCHPVDSSSDPETAEILDGIIRHIEYTSDASIAYDTSLDNAVTGGFGYFRIDVEYAEGDTFDKDIIINRISNPLTVISDAGSNAADSSDWRYCFISELIEGDEFDRRYPKAKRVSFESSGLDELNALWVDGNMVRVAEYWTVEEEPGSVLRLSDGTVIRDEEYQKVKADIFDLLGITVVDSRPTVMRKVKQRIMNGAEFIEETKWAGKYIPIIPVYGEEVNEEGKRHFISMTRAARDPAMMFNFWRSASTELVALAPKAPWIGPKGAFNTDEDKWATANVTNHPYIEYDGGIPPQRQPFAGVPAGALQEAMNASDDIKAITGIYDASLGARSNETSGKAIIARQREGDVGTFHFIDNLSRSIRHAGRILVDLIPKVYTGPRIMRIIGKEGDNDMVQVNQQFQDEKTGIAKIFDLTTGKYDVTCEAGPSYTTQREEAATQQMEFMRVFPQAAPLMGDILARNLDWPGADEIAKRFKTMLPPQLQEQDGQQPLPPQVQQQMQQMSQQMQGMQQHIQQMGQALQAEQAKGADAAKAQAEVQKSGIDLETKKVDYAIRNVDLQKAQIEAQGKTHDMQVKEQERQWAMTQKMLTPDVGVIESPPYTTY
jgi:hypothetical protein